MKETACEDFSVNIQEVQRAAATVLGAFVRLNAAKEAAEQTLAALPRLLRGFAESAMRGEIVRKTGHDLLGWAVIIEGISSQIETACAILQKAGNVTALGMPDRDVLRRVADDVDHEGKRLEHLLHFIAEAPSKIERAPRHLMNNERRQFALENLQVQREALEEVLTEMPTFALRLHRLSSQT